MFSHFPKLKHDLFGPEYHSNGDLISKLCRQLARVHHLKVPIAKSTPYYKQVDGFLRIAYSNPTLISLLSSLNLPNLQSGDLRDELIALNGYKAAFPSPTVFCHNDFLGCNILVTRKKVTSESGVESGSEPGQQKILFIDLEYAIYGGRGNDLAWLLNQHGLDPFEFETIRLPGDDTLKLYLGAYIAACDELIPGYSGKPGNSLETHVQEVKLESLSYLMTMMAFFFKSEESIANPGEPADLEANLVR